MGLMGLCVPKLRAVAVILHCSCEVWGDVFQASKLWVPSNWGCHAVQNCNRRRLEQNHAWLHGPAPILHSSEQLLGDRLWQLHCFAYILLFLLCYYYIHCPQPPSWWVYQLLLSLVVTVWLMPLVMVLLIFMASEMVIMVMIVFWD